MFGDIQNHWAQSQLQSWIDSGILTGDDDALIHPDGALTRSRFMGLLNLAIGSGGDAGLKFADLLPEAADGSDWHPDRNITREEALALVAKLDELDPNATDSLGAFSDRADVDANLEPYVNAAIARHLLPHYEESDQLLPDAAATLAESVVLLQNGLANSSKYFFPIGVWLQSTQNAAAYKAIGVNLYVNLFDPMTNQDLTNLQNAGMKVITDLDRDSAFAGENVIYADYLPPDEPDNAQPDGSGGYGPPVAPQTLIDEYARRKQERPNTPIYLGLGQGVAWPEWYGRGADTGNTAVYSQYAQAGDVLGFDVYPVNSTDEANGGPAGKLWYVAQGVDNLTGYSNGQKPVWADIETTNYESNPGHTPTAADVKAEVWMALVHGAKGITYFAHVLSPFQEAGLLADNAMSTAVSAINRQVQQLAPVLNSPTVNGEVAVLSGNKDVQVDTMVKHEGGATYVFAVGMRDGGTTAKFFGLAGSEAEVIGEGRTIPIVNGQFSDDFAPYGVHLYRIPDSQAGGLSSLQIDGAAVTEWTSGVQFKQIEMPYSTDSVTITADAADPQAEVSGTGEKPLQVGDNVFIVTVATDSGTATYVLNVRRQSDAEPAGEG
ncbi:S-layer homology domain-containing protein [Cohnella sp. CBP 2801]|uniref:S-layer homology domain-containing protein n=1 Tax=Cohnella zeiphila TaxID=2761120 RepID=A0A7X0STW9_9BACL|nr:S-layer homology domain-containing protein [Cohnella zeiphila]